MKNVNKLYLIIICIADAVVAAIVIINKILDLPLGSVKTSATLGDAMASKLPLSGAPLIRPKKRVYY